MYKYQSLIIIKLDFIIYHSMRINAGKMNVNDLFFFKHCRITHKYVLLCGSKPWALLRDRTLYFSNFSGVFHTTIAIQMKRSIRLN